MSLLNDVLKDLEAREQPAPRAHVPAPAQRQSRRRGWIAFALLLGFALLGVAQWSTRDEPEPALLDAFALDPEPPQPRPAATRAQPGAQAPVADPTATAQISGQADEPASRTADAARTDAHQRPSASASLPELAEPELAEAGSPPAPAPSQPEPPQATEPVLANTEPAARRWQTALDESPRTRRWTTTGTGPAPAAPARPPAPAQAPTLPGDDTGTRVVVDPLVVTPIVVRRSAPALDDRAERLAAARRLLARERVEPAIARLETLLHDDPSAREARILLARTLSGHGRPERARQLLRDGLALTTKPTDATGSEHAYALAYWLARLELDAGRPQAALQPLQQYPPPADAPGRDDHHLLHAAILRRLERHDQALVIYRQLAGDESGNQAGNGSAWLGVALSHEALGDIDAARAAYARAARAPDPETARFAQGRLAVLGAPDGTTSSETP
ncbi:MAG: tetratricopeptide repeat protein [Wenzhouxiangellaceae bacterium]|nr:tetratricopeptide repeat protein [Wenzhouxiangellaceae bacterium]